MDIQSANHGLVKRYIVQNNGSIVEISSNPFKISTMKLFNSFKDWKKYILSAIRSVFVGFLRIVWAILNGVVSFVVGVFRSIDAFSIREPKAMLVIIILFTCVNMGWIMYFVNERAMRVSAEMQRDSLILKLDSAKQNAYIREPFANHWDNNE